MTAAPAPDGSLSLHDRVVLVTGSSSGIGAATARALAARGARVVVNSSRSVGDGSALADEIGGHYVQADIGDEQQARDLVLEATRRWGRLDALVNNAGRTTVIPHENLDAADSQVWRDILDVNLVGTWNVTRFAVEGLRASPLGCVVNVTSVAGVRPIGSSIPYAVSKAACNHLTLLLGRVLGPQVRVNAIAPGLVDTPWTADWQEQRAAVERGVPLRRVGTPEDVAAGILMLVQTPYMTGQVVVQDGGLHSVM